MPASVNSTLASFIHDLPWEMVQAAEMPHFWYAFHFNGRLHDWGPFYYFLPCTFIHHEPHLLSLHWDGSHQPAHVRFLPCRFLPLFGMGRNRVVFDEEKVSKGEGIRCRGSELSQVVKPSRLWETSPGIQLISPRHVFPAPIFTSTWSLSHPHPQQVLGHNCPVCQGSLERPHTPK